MTYKKCPNASTYYTITNGEKIISAPISCKRYDCPVCGPRKIKNLKRKLGNACISSIQDWQQKFPDEKDYSYWIKLVTLTLPGKEYRVSGFGGVTASHYSGVVYPQDAYRDIQSNFNKLFTRIRLKFPHMDYIKVAEPQRDGYPHFHILCIGPSANDPDFLKMLRYYWTKKYGMGSSLNVQVIKYGPRAGLKYIMKYLTKYTSSVLEFLPKNCRLVTWSKRIGSMITTVKTSIYTLLEIGRIDPDSKLFTDPFYVYSDLSEYYQDQQERNYQKCLKFFNDIIARNRHHKQKEMLFNFLPT